MKKKTADRSRSKAKDAPRNQQAISETAPGATRGGRGRGGFEGRGGRGRGDRARGGRGGRTTTTQGSGLRADKPATVAENADAAASAVVTDAVDASTGAANDSAELTDVVNPAKETQK